MRTRAQTMNLAGDTRGISLLELTIVLPVLLTIGLGVMEFGNVLYQYHLITVGVRDAARYMSGVPDTAANETIAQNIATVGQATDDGTRRVAGWNPGAVVINYDATAIPNDDGSGNAIYRGGDYIGLVTVSTSYTYQSLGLLGYLGLGTITLTSRHEERIYGNR